MAKLWLPGNSDFALSQREPNLLVPGRKPGTKIVLDAADPLSDVYISTLFTYPHGPYIAGRAQEVTPPSGLSQRNNYVTRNDGSVEYPGIAWPSAEATILLRVDSPVAGNNYFAEFNSYSPGFINSDLYGGLYMSGASYFGDIFPDNNGVRTFIYRFRYEGGTYYAEAWIDGRKSSNVYNNNFALNGKTFYLLGGFTKTVTDRFYIAHAWDRAISDADVARLSADSLCFYRPANSTPYLIGLPGGAPTHSGSGTLTGAGAAVDGVGERTVVGSGVLEGQGAAIAGTGDTAGTVAGDGALVGPGSQIVGAGVRTAVGSGALVADGSDITGVAERIVTGAGVLAGQGSVVSGTGLVEGTATGTGTLVGAGSAIVGTGERTVTGTGDLAAQGSAIVGVGERVVAGSGALVGAGSVVAGTGETGDETVGSGVLVGQGSAVVGTGERIITGAADLIGQGSIIVGTAVRTVIGSGALVGAGSAVSGRQGAHDFIDDNGNVWTLGPRGRVWRLENNKPNDASKRGREACDT